MTSLSRLLLTVSLPLYVLDQVTKWLIVLNFEPGHQKPVIEGFFTLVRVHNQGAAFGLGNGTAWAPIVFFVIAVVALGAIFYFWRSGAFTTVIMRLAGGLLVAGICGNLTDRLLQGFFLPAFRDESFLKRLSEGYVVDFLDFKLPLYDKIVPSSGGHWPSFNVADSCITVAAVFLILSTFFDGKRSEEGESETKT